MKGNNTRLTHPNHSEGLISFTPGEVETYIRARLPNLHKSGGEYRGPCPIHNGTGDNFAISGETGQWFCHSKCGRGGDIISLHMDLQ